MFELHNCIVQFSSECLIKFLVPIIVSYNSAILRRHDVNLVQNHKSDVTALFISPASIAVNLRCWSLLIRLSGCGSRLIALTICLLDLIPLTTVYFRNTLCWKLYVFSVCFYQFHLRFILLRGRLRVLNNRIELLREYVQFRMRWHSSIKYSAQFIFWLIEL